MKIIKTIIALNFFLNPSFASAIPIASQDAFIKISSSPISLFLDEAASSETNENLNSASSNNSIERIVDCEYVDERSPIAQVFYVKGSVLDSSSKTKPLYKGGWIYPDAVVEVGADGFVALATIEGDNIQLQPFTKTRFSCGDNDSQRESYSISTPYLTGAVRG